MHLLREVLVLPLVSNVPLNLLRLDHGMHSDSCMHKFQLAQKLQEKVAVHRHQKRRPKTPTSESHSFRFGLTLVSTSVCDERVSSEMSFRSNVPRTSLFTYIALSMRMKLQQGFDVANNLTMRCSSEMMDRWRCCFASLVHCAVMWLRVKHQM
jgi:hypothetical protein